MNISVIGLGKLGSVIASVYAAAGHRVMGVDLNHDVLEKINAGHSPYSEPGLQELIDRASGNLNATAQISTAVQMSEAAIVIVPTPSEQDGTFSNQFVLNAITEIGRELRFRKRYLVIVASTVSPGSCDGEIRSALEEASGKQVGKEIGLVYSPEFIALGSIIHDMQHPDMVLLGSSDEESARCAKSLIGTIVKTEPKYFQMSLTSAEVAKLAVNTFVTTKISFANMIGELCSLVGDASAHDVLSAIGADSRIGHKYLKPALGYGGPCFPRDNRALQAMAHKHGTDAPLAVATDAVNHRQVDLLVRQIQTKAPDSAGIAVLGMSYKPFTPVCEESQGILLANQLCNFGYKVSVHDPEALPIARQSLDSRITCRENLIDCLSSVDIAVITTPWPVYAHVGSLISAAVRLIDPWQIAR